MTAIAADCPKRTPRAPNRCIHACQGMLGLLAGLLLVSQAVRAQAPPPAGPTTSISACARPWRSSTSTA